MITPLGADIVRAEPGICRGGGMIIPENEIQAIYYHISTNSLNGFDVITIRRIAIY